MRTNIDRPPRRLGAAPPPELIRASWLGGSAHLDDPVPVAGLFTADEVSRALDLTVRGPVERSGSTGSAAFTNDRGEPVLLLSIHRGIIGRIVWLQQRRGTPVAGIGNGAYLHTGGGAVRVPGAVLVAVLRNDARNRPAGLKELLRRTPARLRASS